MTPVLKKTLDFIVKGSTPASLKHTGIQHTTGKVITPHGAKQRSPPKPNPDPLPSSRLPACLPALNTTVPRLLAFRDLGPRKNRQMSRIMYMIEEMGIDKFRETLVEYTKKINPAFDPQPAAPTPAEPYARRDIVGVHPQKQEGKSWVCVMTPAGRLTADEVCASRG